MNQRNSSCSSILSAAQLNKFSRESRDRGKNRFCLINAACQGGKEGKSHPHRHEPLPAGDLPTAQRGRDTWFDSSFIKGKAESTRVVRVRKGSLSQVRRFGRREQFYWGKEKRRGQYGNRETARKVFPQRGFGKNMSGAAQVAKLTGSEREFNGRESSCWKTTSTGVFVGRGEGGLKDFSDPLKHASTGQSNGSKTLGKVEGSVQKTISPRSKKRRSPSREEGNDQRRGGGGEARQRPREKYIAQKGLKALHASKVWELP